MQRCQVRRILLAATCIQILRSLFSAPVDFLEIKLPSTGSRRHLWNCGIATVAGSSSVGAVDSGPTFRTLRKPPEIPVATAVILLRTTQEAALDWGGPFSKPGLYQTNFNKKRTEGLGFRDSRDSFSMFSPHRSGVYESCAAFHYDKTRADKRQISCRKHAAVGTRIEGKFDAFHNGSQQVARALSFDSL